MADPKEVKRLEDLAYEMRKKLLNLCGHYEGAVHIGGDLSMTDLLIGLWHHGLNVNPKDLRMPTRDRFILSKGHGAVCMYIAMSLKGKALKPTSVEMQSLLLYLKSLGGEKKPSAKKAPVGC